MNESSLDSGFVVHQAWISGFLFGHRSVFREPPGTPVVWKKEWSDIIPRTNQYKSHQIIPFVGTPVYIMYTTIGICIHLHIPQVGFAVMLWDRVLSVTSRFWKSRQQGIPFGGHKTSISHHQPGWRRGWLVTLVKLVLHRVVTSCHIHLLLVVGFGSEVKTEPLELGVSQNSLKSQDTVRNNLQELPPGFLPPHSKWFFQEICIPMCHIVRLRWSDGHFVGLRPSILSHQTVCVICENYLEYREAKKGRDPSSMMLHVVADSVFVCCFLLEVLVVLSLFGVQVRVYVYVYIFLFTSMVEYFCSCFLVPW